MGTFDSVYLNKIRQLEEENRQLLKLINEVQSAPPTQPSAPPGGPNFPPEIPPPVEPKLPDPAPVPPTRPRPTNTSVTQRSARQGDSPPTPNRGTWWDPMYGQGGWGVPIQTPYPITMPLPMKTPAPMTMPYQKPFSLNRPYDPNDDPDNFRPTRGMGDGGI